MSTKRDPLPKASAESSTSAASRTRPACAAPSGDSEPVYLIELFDDGLIEPAATPIEAPERTQWIFGMALLVAGRPERMRRLTWPLFDSKFLQQDAIGFKLLLPIELRYLMKKEDATFFQEARLDKQSMVDRLAWSGATLYDLCSARLRACRWK